MKIKVSELGGIALDWAVGEALTWSQAFINLNYPDGFHPSTNWEQGGAIIERERIRLDPRGIWVAGHDSSNDEYTGKTPLIASMRAYVASKLGDEIEIPDELFEGVEQ